MARAGKYSILLDFFGLNLLKKKTFAWLFTLDILHSNTFSSI